MPVIVQSGTLTANAVTTVTFSTYYPKICVLNRGADDLWIRADSTDPVIGGGDSFVIPSFSWKENIVNNSGPTTEIRILSASAVPFTVEGIPF